MNETLKSFATDYLKELLSKCTDGQQMLFKRMYSYENLDMPINDVVDQMAENTLDWATTQCERTVEKNNLNN